MPPSGIPEDIRQFIFDYIDSVEQLEVLLLLRTRPHENLTAEQIATEMRSTAASIELRLSSLVSYGILSGDAAGGYRYAEVSPDRDALIDRLADEYRVRKHKIMELIFSPMKRARRFADAFVMGKTPPSNLGDDNG